MVSVKYRYICYSDLNNYFKKSDLLGGLTTIEQTMVKSNLGIVEYAGGQQDPISKTYTELLDLIQRNLLITGAKYKITDFNSIYSSNTYNSSNQAITWGKDINPSIVYNLIVTAISNNKLDTRVFIPEKNWIIEYDVTKETLPDGVTTKGKITYLKDSNGNSAYYDFKNVRFRRLQTELAGTVLPLTTKDFYTFSDILNGVVIDNSEISSTVYNELKDGCWNNIFIGDTYNNIFEPNCKNNTFLRGCFNNTIYWDSVNNLFNEQVCFTTGAFYNKNFLAGDTSLSTSISKTIHKVNEATIISFLDPITYAYQIIEI